LPESLTNFPIFGAHASTLQNRALSNSGAHYTPNNILQNIPAVRNKVKRSEKISFFKEAFSLPFLYNSGEYK